MKKILWRVLYAVKRLVSWLVFYIKLPLHLMKIERVIRQPSYYPEMERKSLREMRRDNYRWLMKHREVNSLYTGYGLDVKDFRDPDDFLPRRDFCRQRDSGVRMKRAFYGKPFNEVVLVRDKYVFSAYMEATLGPRAIPRTIGLLDNGQVFLHDSREWVSLERFCEEEFRYVFKEIDGTFGDGVRLVKNENGKFVYGGGSHSAEEFAREFGSTRFLIQELIVQHEALRAFKTSCVNTVRAVTIRGKSGKIELFAAFLRVGNDSDTFVDNRAKGGLAVGVEPETGRLMKYGFPHEEFGTKTTVHSLSGIVFEGYQLPFWKEAVELIVSAHRQLPDIATIGWDVTMTDEGPVIVEANDGWEISGPQDTYGGLKERWDRLRNQ